MSRSDEDLQVMIAIREANNGVLTGEIVKEAARPQNHPFHSFIFDKEQGEAADAYYLSRANQLVRTFEIEFIGNGGPTKVRRYASVKRPDLSQRVYEDVNEIAEDPLRRQMLVNQMRRDWATFQARYSHMVEYLELIDQATDAA